MFYLDDVTRYDPLGLEGATVQPLQETQIQSQQRTHSYAAFGQISPHITQNARVDLGIRLTRDERAVDGDTFGVLGVQSFFLAGASQSHSWTEPTWRIGIDTELR